MSSPDLENAGPLSGPSDTVTLDLELSRSPEETPFATDHYEILRIAPQADEDTIERVYRTLADRFHPDNPSTGDRETYIRLTEAYATLSNHTEREKYNLLRQYSKRSTRFRLRGREFFDGVRGGQNRRLAILCLLYRQRITTHEFPGLTVLDLEQLTGCTREEITSALWYLCEKQWARIGEFTAYSITAEGFGFVESKLEDRMEFRALATTCYYRLPPEREDPAQIEERFNSDTLPVDIEPAIASEGNLFIADHYEILGLGPRADEESIERVYRTLASRFHPDNPSTGDAKTFLRIKEAYDTLSDPARRAQYNSLRQRTTKYSERFRLRGREFFDGIRGEQLRRLAVLCLLYRQAASELPGLTVLDLEQLTGCTREELGGALWYLREMKWARFGEFTEYSITAAGFDVVENKLDDREAARTRAWLVPEETPGIGGSEFVYPEISAPPAFAEIWQSEPSEVIVEAAQNTPEIVMTDSGAKPASPIAHENGNSQIAGMNPTDFFQQLLRLQNANGASGVPAQIEETPAPAEEIRSQELVIPPVAAQGQESERPRRGFLRRLFGIDEGAESAAQSEPAIPRTHQSPLSEALAAENGNSSRTAEPVARFEIESAEPVVAIQRDAASIVDALIIHEVVREEPWIENDAEPAPEPAHEETAVEPVAQIQQNGAQQVIAQPEEVAVVEVRDPEPVTQQPAPPLQSNPEVIPQSRGVTEAMNNSMTTIEEPAATLAAVAAKRVIFSMGGKGGVGKTSVMAGLAEWFEENRIPVTLLDLDTENKACGSLTHFFGGRVPKINIYTPAGLDAFVDHLGDDTPVILADMGAGAGQVTHGWFDTMYPDVAEAGVVFTAIGVITADPASVESVLAWAAALQDRVNYIIVENHLTEHADFVYWRDGDQAIEFRRRFQPAIVRLDCRLAELENAARNYGVTLGRIAGRNARVPELQKASVVMRAQSYRRRMSTEFDKVKELLLP